jgi:hypothetical protein
MKDCYYDLGLHFILLYDPSQSYILKLRDRVLPAHKTPFPRERCYLVLSTPFVPELFDLGDPRIHHSAA